MSCVLERSFVAERACRYIRKTHPPIVAQMALGFHISRNNVLSSPPNKPSKRTTRQKDLTHALHKSIHDAIMNSKSSCSHSIPHMHVVSPPELVFHQLKRSQPRGRLSTQNQTPVLSHITKASPPSTARAICDKPLDIPKPLGDRAMVHQSHARCATQDKCPRLPDRGQFCPQGLLAVEDSKAVCVLQSRCRV